MPEWTWLRQKLPSELSTHPSTHLLRTVYHVEPLVIG